MGDLWINMNQLNSLRKCKSEMEKTQEDLASKVFESTAGRAISVKANGKQITEIKLEKM